VNTGPWPDRDAGTLESLISTVRLVRGGVKRWHNPAMVRRWVGTGMIEAQRSFRRIKGYKDMMPFVEAVRSAVARRFAEDEQGGFRSEVPGNSQNNEVRFPVESSE